MISLLRLNVIDTLKRLQSIEDTLGQFLRVVYSYVAVPMVEYW